MRHEGLLALCMVYSLSVCRDPFFLDARAALAAFLYAKGSHDQAEGEWEALQQSGGASYMSWPDTLGANPERLLTNCMQACIF